MTWPFEQGGSYSRANDIHAQFGGQQRGGIATPTAAPGVFIFTGEGGIQHGYSDGFEPDGTFLYTGEGQVGPMRMRGGNRAIRDHVTNGKDLLLFTALGKGRPVRFEGRFICCGYQIAPRPDRNGDMRDAFIFSLMRAEAIEQRADEPADHAAADLAALRGRAYAAAAAPSAGPKQTVATMHQRAAAVRDYVLARAGTNCEACCQEAPFTTSSGRPYLEPHHILRVSDGGPDNPAFMVAVCPNCHRRAHHAHDRGAFNKMLLTHAKAIEATVG